jgi:hypothetical protein
MPSAAVKPRRKPVAKKKPTKTKTKTKRVRGGEVSSSDRARNLPPGSGAPYDANVPWRPPQSQVVRTQYAGPIRHVPPPDWLVKAMKGPSKGTANEQNHNKKKSATPTNNNAEQHYMEKIARTTGSNPLMSPAAKKAFSEWSQSQNQTKNRIITKNRVFHPPVI